MASEREGAAAPTRWEYCLLSATPMTGLEPEGVRLAYLLAMPGQTQQLELVNPDPSPLAAITKLLNQLGEAGWELVAYDTTTHRGVLKRPKD